jgi:hypothetical protein
MIRFWQTDFASKAWDAVDADRGIARVNRATRALLAHAYVPNLEQYTFSTYRSARWRALARRCWGFFYTPATDTAGKPGTPGYRGTRVPVFPFLAIVVNQRLACYRSTRYAASMQLLNCGLGALSKPGGLVLTARADQLHRMPLICAVTADQHVLNMAKH